MKYNESVKAAAETENGDIKGASSQCLRHTDPVKPNELKVYS
ncbi:MAG: hypothetical protein ACI4NQ_05535 [Christensenellales bacterium]